MNRTERNMKTLISFLTIIITIAFASCKNHYEKEFYGTYSLNDSGNIGDARITFYPENTYSFSTWSCLSSNRDSGTFVLSKDIIYFTSFNKKRDEYETKNNIHINRTLTSTEFIYQKNKIGYINKKVYLDHHTVSDTTFWTKDTTKN